MNAEESADWLPETAHQSRRAKGGLRRSAAFWRTFCKSALVMNWITSGYIIQWKGQPPPSHYEANRKGATQAAAFVSDAVADLVGKGLVVTLNQKSWVVSPLSVVERRGKQRLILDLSFVNAFIDKESIHFKYESLGMAAQLFDQSDLLFSIDLEAAYHHVDMHSTMWPFLGFQWQGKYYSFTVLPFGLSSACWVFTKVSRELVGLWREQGIRLIHYLDDFLFGVKEEADGGHAQFDRVKVLIIKDILASGFALSIPKLDLLAAKAKNFLGFIFDLQKGQFLVTEVRVTELMETLKAILERSRSVPVKLLAKAAGQLQSMSRALGPATRIFSGGYMI